MFTKDIAKGLQGGFNAMLLIVAVSVPLAIWKAIDIAVWVWDNININIWIG